MQRYSFLALPLLLLSGCVAGQDRNGDLLVNSNWRFTAIDGAAPVSEKARLNFEKGNIGANVGCNGMGGPWRIEGDRLMAGPLNQTRMFCKGPAWSQEQAIGALLASAPEIVVEGDRMLLKSSGHSAELRREKEASPSGK